jgi:hypothetical protein
VGKLVFKFQKPSGVSGASCINIVLGQLSQYSDWATDRMTGIQFLAGLGIFFLFTTSSRPALGPTSFLFSGYQRIKQLEHEVDHSPPSSAKVKNARSSTSSPPYVFIV